MSFETPFRNWSTVECYVYEPTTTIPETGVEVDVVPRGQTYRLDDTGLYVQHRRHTVFNMGGGFSLDTIRRTLPGYVYDTNDLDVDFKEDLEGPLGTSIKVSMKGWLAKVSAMEDVTQDEVQYNKFYLQDKKELLPIRYTWQEWLRLRQDSGT